MKNKITTELVRAKLQKEKSNQDAETTRLFNSVAHVQTTARGVEVDDAEDEDCDDSPNAATNEPDEDELEDAMNSMDFREEDNNWDVNESDETSTEFDKSCLKDLYYLGWNAIQSMQIKDVREMHHER